MQSKYIGISWQISDRHGWGVFGLNFALNLIEAGPCPPLLLGEPALSDASGPAMDRLQSYLCAPDDRAHRLTQTTLLHALGDRFVENERTRALRGRTNAAFAFFEQAEFDAEAISRAKRWERLLVGSRWNRDVCHDLSIVNAAFVSQGVDTQFFCPGPKQGVPSGRFVIFSGGKLEYRKGQDLVLAAFKRFHASHPDSLLVTAWQNSWAESAATIARSAHITSPPEQNPDGSLNIAKWAADNGAPPNSFVDLGWVPNTRMPMILREADVALFASRAEGGTNLAAMEAMASGVACLLSANTGHLDLIEGDNCYPLTCQSQTPSGPDYWRDSDIDEIVEKLEQAYKDRTDRQRRAALGCQSMQNLSWRNQTHLIAEQLSGLL